MPPASDGGTEAGGGPNRTAETERLAELLRAGNDSAISAEPALAGAAEAISLAGRYFEAAAQRSGEVAAAEPAMSQFREMMASAIERGEPLALKPEYQREPSAPTREPSSQMAQDLDRDR